MNIAIRVSVATAFLMVGSGAGAVAPAPSADDLPLLEQESQHAVATKRISTLFTRAHYKPVVLDDALSAKVFDRYVEALDPSRNVFLADDISKLERFRNGFDEALERGDLSAAFDIYRLSLSRRVERFNYALSLLETPFDFEKPGDVFYYDRENAPWPIDQAEIDELWRQRVKHDALNLKLAGKDWEGTKEVLTKRYDRAIKRLQQTQSEDVFQTVMNSFARSIEAHTSYLSPRNAERFQMEMNLSFEGIGAVLQSDDDYTVIRSIVPGGPADLSKQVKPEDKIIGVAQDDEDFVDVIGWRLDEVVELIKGPKGSTVRLQILKGTSDKATPEVISLVRDKIKLEDRAAKSSVHVPESGPHKGEKLGVITIPSFYNNLHQDVKAELDKLKEEKVQGIIVDLRGNGGGSLSEATLLTGLFIDKGPVVQIRDSAGRIREEKDMDGLVFYEGPLTVMVDRYSASASEIFAAAMQDYGRALIIGEQTFGKGTVQQHRGLGRIYDLFDNPLGSVQFTIAKFYRINGGSTQHKGVVPDIMFPSPIEPQEWGESREENALPWDSIPRANYATFGDASNVVQDVNKHHEERIATDPEFAYLMDDIKEYKARKDDKTLSLVESVRRKEKQEQEAKALARTNERLARMGLEKVENLDDLPEALENIDPFLNEAAAITFDMVGTGKYAFQSK
ncbi:carboxy terminal-processing peptidase [Aliiglaciecola sp. CAU 1673]|uniref:carboxy terminal-processing peptidase n=1 Tax=Aliiglaciecola sp. CAU 1673 TaxID=3032595 RepID=UPI0023D9ED3A|nr:carboxy terminal-processing peptidase [Aliiglaciecola sp. CAU 1673]MDF2177536.1 carboxy terminal-processing peptidase [Aliiglaciecola sp. CAU 1673]